MDNKEIVKNLRQVASFMELHGENEFKIRGYNNAVYNIERLTDPLEKMDPGELEKVNGIGKSIAARILELIDNGKISLLEDLRSQTPPGVIEMMNIKGLGNKKIRTLWQELDITSIQDLKNAIDQGILNDLKGFGGKVLENIQSAVQFYILNKSKIHYNLAEDYCNTIIESITKDFPSIKISPIGELRRKMEVVDVIPILIGHDNSNEVIQSINTDNRFSENEISSPFIWRGTFDDCPVPIEIHFCKQIKFYSTLYVSTGSALHLSHIVKDSTTLVQLLTGQELSCEEDAFKIANLPYIEPELREGLFEFKMIDESNLPDLLEMKDLKGILHNHSHYSDGRHSLRDMAEYCKSLGYEYLGISDHSKAAAFYANGMDEDRVRQQHEEIDKLNEELAPFKIFKGIEADILPDGSLDYDPDTLSLFDFVVASVHSVLNMDLEKAMDRMIRAIQNPFTTILGHPTGRQLLIREGYPLNHQDIIDACAENDVIIEVNSHPNRLDLDWRWIPYALEKNVMLSINPDAHSKEGFHDMYYGVCVARKGGLFPEMTLNSKNVREVEEYFAKRKKSAIKSD